VLLTVPDAESGLPQVLHWGKDLGDLDDNDCASFAMAVAPAVPRNTLDCRWPLTILPTQSDGWLGRPGLGAHRSGRVLYPHWNARCERTQHSLVIHATDVKSGISYTAHYSLVAGGLLGVDQRIRNTGSDTLEVTRFEALLPVPDTATELLDFTGRWAKERTPQRAERQVGARGRESRRGRTGHDAATTLYSGTPGFTYGTGEVWGTHVAYSGNHVHAAERLPEGAGGAAAVLGGGELLEPGEMVLEPGAEYAAPRVWFTYSANGLDEAANRFHTWLRARPEHPCTNRPLLLNTWEAVYLHQDQNRLFSLAERAAEIGVERFVLDDGWFHGRPDTTRCGLGDWWADENAWPNGLGPIADRIHELGMEFGLWVEPEMVNLDSDFARHHPDWLLAAPQRIPRPARHQQALDVARPEVANYLADALSALIDQHDIAYLKWDHNRDIHEAIHGGAAGIHRQTNAVYALLDRLRDRHPGLEIESCASGGARADL